MSFAPAWSGAVVDGAGGSGTFEDKRARSAPRAFGTRLPAGCTRSYAQLVHKAESFPARMHVAAYVAITSAPTAAGFHIFGTETLSATGHFRIDLTFAADRLVLVVNDAGATTFHSANATFAVGQFARVEMELGFVGATRARVTVDGATQIDKDVTIPALTTPSARFELGNYAEEGCDRAVETWFDDVVYTLTPR